MKGTLSFLLAAIMVFATTACGSVSPSENQTDTTPGSSGTVDETDLLPEIFTKGLNFGGETITFLYRADAVSEFYVEESTGDIVDDALFESRSYVEDALNVKLEVIERSWLDTGREQYTNHIATTVLSGDDVYDWVDQIADEWYKLVPQGLMVDLSDNEYIDLSKPWWNSGLVTDANIGGGIFYLVGDYSLGYLKDIYCIYFNKELAEECRVGDLYSLVREGKWTIDKAMELSALAAMDINGDGTIDIENDRLGFVMHDLYHLPGFIASCNVNLAARDGDSWIMGLGTERDHGIVEKLNKLLYNTDGNYIFPASRTSTANLESYGKVTSKFISGDILFLTSQMNDAVTDLRDMKSDYGILPFPKYEESQETYQTFSRSTHAVVGMPATCADYAMAAAVIEAIAAANHERVIPAYYETALKVKYSRDDDSAEMYDLILSGATLNFGYLNKNCMKASGTTPSVELFMSGVKDPNTFMSKVAANRENCQKLLDDYVSEVSQYVNK